MAGLRMPRLPSIGPFVGRPFGEYFAAFASEGNDAFFEMFLEAIRGHEGRF